jgi:hypothetical protein
VTTEFEEKGSLPAEKPVLVEEGRSLFGLKVPKSLDSALLEHLNSLKKGDYFAP